ncbi:hypothetical protein ACHAXS_003351 [Conticribra weissflogii]
MFVNGIAFLVTVSRGLKFITTHYLPSRETNDLTNSLRETIKIYQRGGFKIQTVLMDGEFEKVKPHLPEVIVNTTAAGEHVGEVERQIRTIKERARGITCTMPYQKMPGRMIVDLIYFCTMWLNATPNKNGVSEDYSPRELVVRQRLDYKRHCRVPFGAYCEVFEDRERTNTMASRTRSAISLGPTGNMQGSYKFLCLETGRVIRRRQFKELPMPGSVIKKVEELGKDGGSRDLVFSDRNRVPFMWTNDETTAPSDPGPVDRGEEQAEFPGIVVEDSGEAGATEQDDDDAERRQAHLAAQNANLDVEQPQLTFGRRHVSEEEQAIIQDILEGVGTGETEDGLTGDADEMERENEGETSEPAQEKSANLCHGVPRRRRANPTNYWRGGPGSRTIE